MIKKFALITVLLAIFFTPVTLKAQNWDCTIYTLFQTTTPNKDSFGFCITSFNQMACNGEIVDEWWSTACYSVKNTPNPKWRGVSGSIDNA